MALEAGCVHQRIFKHSQTGNLERASWRWAASPNTLKAGNPEDANWSYGDSCGPHGMLKYVRSVHIISSGAVELAGGHSICRNLKAGGPEKVKWLCI